MLLLMMFGAVGSERVLFYYVARFLIIPLEVEAEMDVEVGLSRGQRKYSKWRAARELSRSIQLDGVQYGKFLSLTKLIELMIVMMCCVFCV